MILYMVLSESESFDLWYNYLVKFIASFSWGRI